VSDARRAAEEALAVWDTLCARSAEVEYRELVNAVVGMVKSLRALLAEPEATPRPSCSTRDGYGYTTVPVHDRNGYPIPEQRKCDDCDGTGRAPAPLAPPPAPCPVDHKRTPVPWIEGMTVIANPIMPKGAIFIHPDTLAGKPDALAYHPPAPLPPPSITEDSDV